MNFGWIVRWSVILAENRYPVFRIMLQIGPGSGPMGFAARIAQRNQPRGG